jgi:hypothetical protein
MSVDLKTLWDAATSKRIRLPRVNATVRPQDRERVQSTQDVVRDMLLAGKRFTYRDVERVTGSPKTAQRVEELRRGGMVIKSELAAHQRCAEYWMEQEDIETAKANLGVIMAAIAAARDWAIAACLVLGEGPNASTRHGNAAGRFQRLAQPSREWRSNSGTLLSLSPDTPAGEGFQNTYGKVGLGASWFGRAC